MILHSIFHEIKNIIPPISNLKPDLINIEEGKTMALLNIPKATESFFSINNEIWIRLHKSNKKLTPYEVVKLSYAKGFEKADKELVDIDFELLQTIYFQDWRKSRNIGAEKIEDILFQTGLARKNEDGAIKPTRATVFVIRPIPQ